jgi:lipopolysaccharide/colanic/teichoic acid biosynthesis glycosyltransferase
MLDTIKDDKVVKMDFSNKRRAIGFLKKVSDYVFAFILLFIFFPFFIIIPLLLKFICRDSPLFVQKRLGYKGKEFKMYKFKTMKTAASGEKNLQIAELGQKARFYDDKANCAITPLGKFLRRSSLDELPQLFNVLRGQMSLVGPRPFMPNKELRQNSLYGIRSSKLPGITGLPQIKGRGDLTIKEWLLLDARYVDNWSLFLDFKIILLTVPVVLSRKGAY